MINAFLDDRALRTASEEVAAEMAAQACPTEVAKNWPPWRVKGNGRRGGFHL